MKIFLGADHRGFKLKEEIKKYLQKKRIAFEDLGNFILDSQDDYPDFAIKVAEKAIKTGGKGILICGSGGGVCITANKVKGTRAAQPYDLLHAKKLREDDDINILCLAADWLGGNLSKKIVKIFLETKFSRLSRHKRRLQKIKSIEKGF